MHTLTIPFSYARYATAWVPVSEHTTLDVHFPSLTGWVSSQKSAESLRELELARKSSESQKGAEWSEGLQAARMTLYGQEALGSRKDAE